MTLTGTSATWTTLPALPSSAQVSSTSAALALVRCRPAGASADRMALGVQTTTDRLARITTNASGTAWNTAWTTGTAGALAVPTDHFWHGNGAGVALPVGAGTEPVFFGPGGVNILLAQGYTLQGFSDAFAPPFRDYVRYQLVPTRVLGFGEADPGSSANVEATVAETLGEADALSGFATGIRRNGGVPWEVVVGRSTDAMHDWGRELVVSPLAPIVAGVSRDSVTDPYAARVPGGGGALHHLSVQVGLTPACGEVDPTRRRIVYRTASTLSTLASLSSGPDLQLIRTGRVDHGGLAVTTNGSQVTAHVAYNDDGVTPPVVRYWRYPLGGTATETVVSGLANRRAGVSRGVGQNVYAWGFTGTGMPVICPVFPTSGTCITVPAGGTSVQAPDIRFGTGAASAGPGRACWRPFDMQWYPCFDTQQPVALYFSQTKLNHVFAAWQAEDPDATMLPGETARPTSIYFSASVNGLFTDWTTPQRVHPRATATMYYVDPSITVDHAGTIVVTYSAVENDQPSPTATHHVSYSTSGGTAFTQAAPLFSILWYPATLSLHCLRNKYFLGEYIEGDVFGARAYHTVHRDANNFSTMNLEGFWASAWSIL